MMRGMFKTRCCSLYPKISEIDHDDSYEPLEPREGEPQ